MSSIDDYKIEAPEVGPAFEQAASGEVTEKKPRTPPVMEYKVKPPTLAMRRGGHFEEMSWTKSESREVDLPEQKTLRERAAERRADMERVHEFEEASHGSLAARRNERSVQEREGMQR